MKRPAMWAMFLAGGLSTVVAFYFDAAGLWWLGLVLALFIGPACGWYMKDVAHRVAAFRAGWAAAGRHNKRVDGS